MNKTIKLNGYITASSCQILLDSIRQEFESLTVHVNSPGGFCDPGFSLFFALRKISPKVRTIATGYIGSMANLIFLAGSTRLMTLDGSLYFHTVSLKHESRNGQQPLKYTLSGRERLLLKFWNEVYAKSISNSVQRQVPWETVMQWMESNRTIRAQEALELGLVTQIVSIRKSPAK
jgi:ATP-dependent protease ClpP protease subunit